MKKSFSVLTVSKRHGWELMAFNSIDRQTEQPAKWVIVHEDIAKFLDNTKYTTLLDTASQVRLVQAPKQVRLSNLNASLNEGLRRIDTDYVIFYQDLIELQEDCFDKLLNLVDEKTFVTTCTPNYDGSNDGRYTGIDCPRVCRPEEWEANVAIAPMHLIRSCGGFDDRLDNGWSWDNVLLAKKAAMLGAKFVIDEGNRPKLYPHEMSSHETLPKNGALCERILKDVRSGKEPLNCNCL